MGAEKTKTDFRGILIPDPRLTIANFSAADSTYTEANPRPGVPVPDDETGLVLSSSGTQAAQSSIDIQALRAGHPIEGGGGYVWKETAGGATTFRGWDVPTVITAWEALTYSDGTGVSDGVKETHEPHAVTLGDGQILIAYRDKQINSGITTYNIITKRRSTASAWSTASAYTYAYTPSEGDPCLVVLPSGRVLLFHWIVDSALSQAQIRMHFSDDKGSTWTVGQELTLDTPIDTAGGASGHALGRIRAEIISGEILLIAEVVSNNTGLTYREGFVQLASDDLGASFKQVYKTDGTKGGGRFSVLNVGGVFHAYFVDIATREFARFKVGSAFQSFENASLEDLVGTGDDQVDTEVWGLLDGSSKFFANVDCSAWKDENGIVYVAGRQPTIAGFPAIVVRSADNGATWAGMGQTSYSSKDFSAWYTSNDSATYIRDFAMTAQGGRAVAFHNWTASPGNEDNSLGVCYLGGWSQVTMPGYKTFARDNSRVGFEINWLPFDLPDNVGWTAVTSGTESGTLTGGALNITTGTGRHFYTIAPPGTPGEGMIVRCTVDTANSAAPGHEVLLQTTVEDGAEGFRVRATFRDTGIILTDMYNGGGTQIGGTLTIDCTAGVQFLIGINDGKCSAWARLNDTSDDRQWTNIVSNQALVDNGGGGANEIKFGNDTASAATSLWSELHYVSDEYAGQGLAEGQTNPTDLFPRAFSTSPQWVTSGVYVQAKDGPCFRGQEWTIATRAEFPVSNILPAVSPSPREKWRTTGTAQARLGFKFDEGGAMSSVMGLYLDGINFRTGSIEGWDGAAWQTITTFDAATELNGLPYVRQGAAIRPSLTGHTAQRYIEFDELDGATVDLGSSKFRKIIRNTAGLWSDTGGTTVTKPAEVHFEGLDGSEPASGTAQIWAPRLLVTIRNATNYTGYRLVIDSQTNADGYFEIGSAILGPVFLFDRDYSWGRILGLAPNTELTTAQDGTRRSRVLGPSRRHVEFGWIDGVDLKPVLGINPDPAYYSATSTASKPAALDGETPLLIRGLVGFLGGSHTPCVYLANVAKGTPDVQQTTAQDAAIYGRVMTGVRLETVQGVELEDEVTRLATITIEQEL